jgi:hypothetical protein
MISEDRENLPDPFEQADFSVLRLPLRGLRQGGGSLGLLQNPFGALPLQACLLRLATGWGCRSRFARAQTCGSRMTRVRTHLPQVEEDGGGKTNRREEGMGAAVIAHRDPSPVFQSGKHVLDLIAPFVERLVVVDRLFAVLGRRNARLDPTLVQGGAEMVAVVATVADQGAPRMVLDDTFTCSNGSQTKLYLQCR